MGKFSKNCNFVSLYPFVEIQKTVDRQSTELLENIFFDFFPIDRNIDFLKKPKIFSISQKSQVNFFSHYDH